jgi:hypothetical protein
MKDAIINALIRALRTFAQTALGVYLAGLAVAPTLGDLGTWPLIQAALAAGIVAVLWNLLESLGGEKYPSILKG